MRVGMQAEAWMRRLTLEQKLAQMIVMRGHDYARKARLMNEEGRLGAVGAVMLTIKGSRALADIVSWVNDCHAASSAPILFYLDAENGLADTFEFGTPFPTLMALGATRSRELAYEMGRCIAKEARAVGFGVVSNPTVDVNSNPDNPIINTRAIGDRVELVSELAADIVRGMQEAGVIPTAKHFPGHGDTQEDSHVSMPVVARDKASLMQVELAPYRALIPQGLLGIMTAHILYPALLAPGEERVPATLSRTIMTDLLRGELGFEGLLVSDSLTMRAVKLPYGIERAAVLAVKAGHDLILQDYESDPEVTLQALLAAVHSGEIGIDHIDSSVRRILTIKEKLGLLEHRLIAAEEAARVVRSPEHAAVAATIADRSVTVLEASSLPFTGKPTLVIATIGEEEGREAEDLGYVVKSKTAYLRRQMTPYAGDFDMLLVREHPTEEDLAKVEHALAARDYDQVIYATFVRVLSYKEGSGTVPRSQLALIDSLRRRHPQTALLIFGSPYILRQMTPPANCLCAYGDCEYSIDAALKVLFGRMRAQGKLPVTVNDRYPFGFGLC